jgi:hypothetical protein
MPGDRSNRPLAAAEKAAQIRSCATYSITRSQDAMRRLFRVGREADRAAKGYLRRAAPGETRNGAIGGGHDQLRKVCEADRFTSNTAAAVGKSERIVQLDAERGKKISDENR